MAEIGDRRDGHVFRFKPSMKTSTLPHNPLSPGGGARIEALGPKYHHAQPGSEAGPVDAQDSSDLAPPPRAGRISIRRTST